MDNSVYRFRAEKESIKIIKEELFARAVSVKIALG